MRIKKGFGSHSMDSQVNKGYAVFANIRSDLLICLFLVIATLAVYWQVQHYTFIDFDDDLIVLNPYVQDGLSLKGICWSFSTAVTDGKYWKPLTWLSHMLDYQLYGADFGMHHSMNLILHVINSILLFLVFQQMSNATWRSAFVAGLFALHPLNVESVAWITQRHNVLSSFFGLLTLYSYTFYTKYSNVYRYAMVLSIFTLGLMAKPMLITLPFVLLLLDYWPLGRIADFKSKVAKAQIKKLVLEKIPFLVLSLISILLSFQRIGSSFVPAESFPIALRIENALVSYVKYILKMIWPHDMAVYYPYPDIIPAWQWIGAGLLLVCFTFFSFRMITKKPYLIVGWLWYVGTLVPVIGLVQAGLQPELADRNAYISFIGLFIIIAWGGLEILSRWRYKIIGFKIIVLVILIFFMIITWQQVKYWTNSITLFKHAIKVTENNFMAHNNLGFALAEQGKTSEAIDHYKQALKILPDFELAHLNMGVAKAAQGRHDAAVSHYQAALKIRPGLVAAHNNLGNIKFRQDLIFEAMKYYSEALRINPDYAEALNGMGGALVRTGKLDEAIYYFRKALEIRPGFIKAERNLYNVLEYKRKNSIED